MTRWNIRFFNRKTNCFWNQRFHCFIKQIVTTHKLRNDGPRRFALTESRNVYTRRNLLVRSLKMLLHKIIFYFDVKNCLTIFAFVTSKFQRVLRNNQLAKLLIKIDSTATPCKKVAPQGAPQSALIVTQGRVFWPRKFRSVYTYA